MAKRNEVRPRKCGHCNMTLTKDAKGIKEHAEKCIHNKKKR